MGNSGLEHVWVDEVCVRHDLERPHETVSLRGSGLVERHEDLGILPTADIPLTPVIALFLAKMDMATSGFGEAILTVDDRNAFSNTHALPRLSRHEREAEQRTRIAP